LKLVFSSNAWEDYLYWQKTDRKILRRINDLIRDSLRSPMSGLGKPEPLRGNYSGWWSRRINHEHRMIYRARDNSLEIAQLRYHY